MGATGGPERHGASDTVGRSLKRHPAAHHPYQRGDEEGDRRSQAPSPAGSAADGCRATINFRGVAKSDVAHCRGIAL